MRKPHIFLEFKKKTKEINKLIDAAMAVREMAYAPYSNFTVGAALLTESGEIFTGCNVENLAYPAGMCAERAAIFSAVAKGQTKFRAIAVTGGAKGEKPASFCMPCGMCRQVMSEFCDPSFEIYVLKSRDEVRKYHLGELLPHAFDSML